MQNRSAILGPLIVVLAVATGCAQAKVGAGESITGGAGGHGGAGAIGGAGGTLVIDLDASITGTTSDAPPASPDLPPPLTDFPTDPVIDGTTVPANAPTLFTTTAARSDGAPCIVSPTPNTLMPKNWLRPRFEFFPANQENLFEITVSVPGFAHPLRIYTMGDTAHAWHNGDRTYVLDRALWEQLRNYVVDTTIDVQIRAMTVSSTGSVQVAPSAAATTSFIVAPVEAPGKIVYWAVSAATASLGLGSLKGFGIGEEGVEDVLKPEQVSGAVSGTDGCIGCHTATPDGKSVGMVMGPPMSNIGLDTYYEWLVDITPATLGASPSYVDPAAVSSLRKVRGGSPAFSGAHWFDGDHIEITGSDNGDLLWTKLDSPTAQGKIVRNGDANLASAPAFSHDGNTIAYVSSNGATTIHDGRFASGPADIYTVPYNNQQGGAATPLQGASDPNNTEYYPAFSPDDHLIAFTSFVGNAVAYGAGGNVNAAGEVFVVSAQGGTSQRLPANDPPACVTSLQPNIRSPGVTNDWPKWSPHVAAANGKSYYWLTFSSSRSGRAQLFVTGIIASGNSLTLTPALYLWNQPVDEGNHTPSWDDWQIPPVPMVY